MSRKSLLKSLRDDFATPAAEAVSDNGTSSNIGQTTLPIDVIRPNPDQPRKRFSEEKHGTLVESIKARGILQPIRVLEIRTLAEYEIIAGERRWRAAKEAGITHLPAVIVRGQAREQAYIDAFIENVERENLDPISRAEALEEIKVHLGALSWDELLATGNLGINRRQLFNLLGLLKLPEEIQNDIANKTLTEKHGRALRALGRDPALQAKAWQHMKANNVSSNDALAYVQTLKGNSASPRLFKISYRTDLELIEQLEAKLRELRAHVT